MTVETYHVWVRPFVLAALIGLWCYLRRRRA